MKAYTECYTIDEFIEWYDGASKAELNSNLKRIGNPSTRTDKNEVKAIIALKS